QMGGDRRFGFGVKGLVGAGRATLQQSVTFFDGRDDDDLVRIQGAAARVPVPIITNVRVRDEFLLAEPEGHVIVNLSKRFRLTAGAGYRFAGSRERGTRDNLNGATGSIALQIGTGGA